MTAIAETSLRSIFRCAAYPLALGLVGAALCYLAAGRSLGFFLGALAVACCIVPPLVAGASDRFAAVIVAGAVIDAIGIAWLVAVLRGDLTILQWLGCYIVLAAVVFGLAGAAWALRHVVGPLASAAIVVAVAGAWLTWPIWTSPWITTEAAAWLAPAHPPLAINRVLLELGVWTQQPWMYRHTTLGQDVAFALPRTIWPCVLLHAIMATGLLARPARLRDALRQAEPAAPVSNAAGSGR